jgi:hypothetical protein
MLASPSRGPGPVSTSVLARQAFPSASLSTYPMASTFIAGRSRSASASLRTRSCDSGERSVEHSAKDMLAVIDLPGPIEVETVASVDWVVPRKGLINLDNPRARAAGLADGLEPIQIYFHALRHPTRGLFLVDTGVERAQRDRPDKAAFRGLVASQMHLEALKVQVALGDWFAAHPGSVAGVFLTHLHPDHLTGMADVAAGTPVYAGPGEPSERGFVNIFLQPNIDRALAGKGLLAPWLGARPHRRQHRLPPPHAARPGAPHRRRLPHALGMGPRRGAWLLLQRRAAQRRERGSPGAVGRRASGRRGEARSPAVMAPPPLGLGHRSHAGATSTATSGSRGSDRTTWNS